MDTTPRRLPLTWFVLLFAPTIVGLIFWRKVWIGATLSIWLVLNAVCSLFAAYVLVDRTESPPLKKALVVIWAAIIGMLNAVTTVFAGCLYRNTP